MDENSITKAPNSTLDFARFHSICLIKIINSMSTPWSSTVYITHFLFIFVYTHLARIEIHGRMLEFNEVELYGLVRIHFIDSEQRRR